MSNVKEKTRALTMMGILTAIVIVLQALGSFIKLGPFSIALAFVPITIGAALYGWKAGAWLGFAFSVVVLFTDSAAFLGINAIGTIITVFAKGTLAGISAAGVYRLLEKKNQWIAAILSAFTCQFVNKALFIIGCAVFFLPTITEWASGKGYNSTLLYLLIGLGGLNFLIEWPVNIILSTVIVRVVAIAKHRPAN